MEATVEEQQQQVGASEIHLCMLESAEKSDKPFTIKYASNNVYGNVMVLILKTADLQVLQQGIQHTKVVHIFSQEKMWLVQRPVFLRANAPSYDERQLPAYDVP